MYSSQAESESLSFCATIGNQSSQFYDTIIINFPDGFFDEFEHVTVFADVFKQCTRIFQPYWGCIADTAFFKKARAYCPLVCHRRCIGLTFGLIQFLMELDESES